MDDAEYWNIEGYTNIGGTAFRWIEELVGQACYQRSRQVTVIVQIYGDDFDEVVLKQGQNFVVSDSIVCVRRLACRDMHRRGCGLFDGRGIGSGRWSIAAHCGNTDADVINFCLSLAVDGCVLSVALFICFLSLGLTQKRTETR